MDPRFVRVEELSVRLEIVRGLPIWEAHPAWKHQQAMDRIRASITPAAGVCPCLHVADVYVSFHDGSLKRPDIALFYHEPDEEEEAITLLPAAIIEVVSRGYEAKDLEIGPSFYLSQGVADVVVFDPSTLLGRRDGAVRRVSPVALECGCRCVV
jgi:Uma2 family endonuclease